MTARGTSASFVDLNVKEVLGFFGDDCIIIDKFGENPDVGATEEDIWQAGGTETLLTSGATMYVSCTDNTNGVGQVLRVEGLDENWELQTGFGTLTGNTQAAIVSATGAAQSWTRIFRGFQVSAAPDPVGDVYIAELDGGIIGGVPQTASLIHGYIDFTDAAQQTEKAMYTIPAGYTGFIYRARAGILTASGTNRSANVHFEIANLAQGATVASPSWAPFRRVAEAGAVTDGSSYITEVFIHPVGPLPELTNVHMRASATASSRVVGSFMLKLVKNIWLP